MMEACCVLMGRQVRGWWRGGWCGGGGAVFEWFGKL